MENTETIEDLKKQRIWVCFKITKSEGHWKKEPVSASGGTTGSSKKHEHTWVTYEEAREAAERNNYDGVAFALPKDYFFQDMDEVDVKNPLVQLMLERYLTYAEISISGTGVHYCGRCDTSQILADTHNDDKEQFNREFFTINHNNGIELYIGGITNKFVIYTGNVIMDEPLRDCTQAVLTTLDKDMRKKPKVKYSPKRDGEKADFDIALNLKKQKNGEKFCKLYDRGDFSDYPSQSEADAALCAMIAFRTGPDPDAIDEVFRGSALYRQKWEREDYRERTINLGIEACHGTFHKSVMDHPPFVRFDDNGQPYIVVPLLAKYVREHLRYILVRNNGKQGLLKYVYEDGVYRLYSDSMFIGLIKQIVADYDEELVRMGKMNEVMQLINTDLDCVKQDELDADETLINFRNGLLRVTATETTLLPHSPDVLSTIQIPCEWTDTPPPTPQFDSYMHTLTNGDAAVDRLLLEFIGACLSNIKGWRMKKSLFLVGKGDTGKSQLKSLVERLLGRGNYIGIDLKEIEARFGTGAIYGTRLAGSSDMSFMTVDELKTFKKITGGDSLFAEFKGQQAFEFTYNGLLWFCMNRLPKFGGDDGQWVYDRIMVVECPNVIPKDMQDKQLLDKLYAEREGIVYKAVKALQTVIANGYRFSEPQSVTDARDTYMEENNSVISFFNECMCPWPDGRINRYCTTGRIYRVYQAWCRENNNGYAKTAKEFRDTLCDHLRTSYQDMTTRMKGNTYYTDYSLTDEAKEQFSREYGYDGGEFLGTG